MLPAKPLLARLRLGGCISGSLVFRAGSRLFSVYVTVTWPLDGLPHLTLCHSTRTADQRAIRYRIELERTPCRFGGGRWWFRCPSTGRLAHKLFLPRGGESFLSRPAYRLAYASQRLDDLGKLQQRKWLLIRRLGGDWEAPLRPKGMHDRTYARLLTRLEEVEGRIDACFLAGLEKIHARHGRLD